VSQSQFSKPLNLCAFLKVANSSPKADFNRVSDEEVISDLLAITSCHETADLKGTTSLPGPEK